MAMVVTCESCGSRFRLRMALLKDSKAARLRCRKCGGYIVVLVPKESQAPPAARVSGVVRPEPSPSPVPAAKEVVSKEDSAPSPRARMEETSPPPAAEPAAPTPPVAIDLTPSAPHASPAGQPEAALPGTDTGSIHSQLEKLFASPLGKYTGPERKVPSRRPPPMLALLIISVLCVLLLAAGALYFGTTKPGQERLGRLFAGWGSGRTGSAPERPVYDIRDVKWYVDKSSAGGSLFVIKGFVANVGKVPSKGIRIQATLLGKDNDTLVEQAAFAGNPLDEAATRRMERAGIEGVMSNRFGQGNVNMEIPKGKALPFMVVFIDSPGQVESFMVRAIDVE